MKHLPYVFIILLFIIISFIFVSDRLSYNNCMIQVQSDYISKRGAAHVAAQCKAFILEKIMLK